MDELAQLRSTIDRADNIYYRTGQAIMSDREYDALKARLRELAPDDERHTRVGPAYTAEEIGSKSQHKIPMGSLDNIDGGLLGIQDWYDDMCQRLKVVPTPDGNLLDIMMSLKVDGSSIALGYVDGKLTRAVTRGNGQVGEDITANAVMFQGVPTVLPQPITCTVRGEAILYKSDFQRITAHVPLEERSNERNTGNGIIGREDGTQSELIHFIAFNLVNGEPETEATKYTELAALGFQVVAHELATSATEMEGFYREALANRASLDYHIDGVVCVLNLVAHQHKFITADPRTQLRPKFARCCKFPAYFAITKVTGVVVTVGHNRVVCPTLAVERVRCGGVFVDSVIITNYDEIKRQDVQIGDTVSIFLAGDVVPNLSHVIPMFTCPECGFTGTEAEQQAHHS